MTSTLAMILAPRGRTRLNGALELGDVEDRLRLEEADAGLDLLLGARKLHVPGLRLGEHRTADVEAGRTLEFVAHHVVALVHAHRHLRKLGGVEVEHALRIRMVAGARVVTGHHEHVLETERPGREQVALQREAVPVAARLLEDRLDPPVEDRLRGGKR